jgi:hypothetical protein
MQMSFNKFKFINLYLFKYYFAGGIDKGRVRKPTQPMREILIISGQGEGQAVELCEIL